jgi:hypothetical protein
MEPKLIANFSSGLNQYYKPWLMPEDAFVTLDNSYLYRGSLQKREGFQSIHPTQINPLSPGPVMGLSTRFDEFGNPSLVAFNKTKAFQYDANNEIFVDFSGATTWGGTDLNYFWTTNGFSGFFVTNNFDPIRYYNQTDGLWYDLIPQINGPTTLDTALMVVAHNNYLLAMNTVEAGYRWPQRIRVSSKSNPYATGVPPLGISLLPNSWRTDGGGGSFLDIPTGEPIISSGFNRDNLIIQCPNSTWRLRFTGNNVFPYELELVNSQLGCDSTFSSISFDEAVFSTSRRGITGSNTNEVKRIDEKIPNIAVNFNAKGGNLKRIQGGRDFFHQLALWTYCSNEGLPDRLLVFNYLEGSWATWDLAFTALGSAATTSGLTWDDADFTWDSVEAASLTWESSSNQNGSPFLVAGTEDGSVFRLVEGIQDNGFNFNFDVLTKRFMFYGEQGQKARLNYVDLYLTGTSGGEFIVEHYVNEDSTTPVMTKVVSSSSAKDTLYTRVFLGAVGRTHQLRFRLNGLQLNDPVKGSAPWQLQGMVLWISPAGRINDP